MPPKKKRSAPPFPRLIRTRSEKRAYQKVVRTYDGSGSSELVSCLWLLVGLVKVCSFAGQAFADICRSSQKKKTDLSRL